MVIISGRNGVHSMDSVSLPKGFFKRSVVLIRHQCSRDLSVVTTYKSSQCAVAYTEKKIEIH